MLQYKPILMLLGVGLLVFMVGKYLVECDLRLWTIPNVKQTLHVLNSDQASRGPSVRTRYMPLFSPGGRITAIVECATHYSEDNSPAVLNPRHLDGAQFEYGPIPELSKISISDAEKLWGPSHATGQLGDLRTFSLLGEGGGSYNLVMEFSNSRAKRYLISGPLIFKSQWIEIANLVRQ